MYLEAPVAEGLRALVLIHLIISLLFHNHLDHLTAVFDVGSSHALATCETRQVLLAGVPGGFTQGHRFLPNY